MKFLRENKNLKNKRVLLRVDFNIDIDKKGGIIDDFRIKAVLPTIKYLLAKGAKVIIMSHLGRPDPKSKIKNQKSKLPRIAEQSSLQGRQIKNEEFSLRPIANYLSKLLKKEIKFLSDCIGEEIKKEIGKMRPAEIAMLENLRFYEGEEKNDPCFAKELAELGDIYVNDAFGVSHRANASVEAIVKYLPSCAGLLLEKEIKTLGKLLKCAKSPLVLVLGGAKIETKLPVLNYWQKKADKILVGGAIANTFLKALGFKIGQSLSEDGYENDVRKIMKTNKVVLPQDVKTERGAVNLDEVGERDKILDIGSKTVKIFNCLIKKAKIVIWNGPLGYFEDKKFATGTREIGEAILKNKKAKVIIGGGETVASLKIKNLPRTEPKVLARGQKSPKQSKLATGQAKIKNNVFISTGGGAMLEFLAGKKLPGIEALK